MNLKKREKPRHYIRDGRSPIPNSEKVSRVMSSNLGKDTKPEIALRKALRSSGLPGYRLHWPKVPGRPDIAYPGKKLAIFVHGCFWHRCPSCNPSFPKIHQEFWSKKFQRNKERDEEKVKELGKIGWKVIVVWECQLKEDINVVVERIRKGINHQVPYEKGQCFRRTRVRMTKT